MTDCRAVKLDLPPDINMAGHSREARAHHGDDHLARRLDDPYRILEAIDALRRGDAHGAFYQADRRCRLDSAPTSRHLCVRAIALQGMGASEEARASLETAFALDPNNLAAARLLLASEDGALGTAASRTVMRLDRQFPTRALAARHLLGREGGPHVDVHVANASVRICVLAVRSLDVTVAWHDGAPVDGDGLRWRNAPQHSLWMGEATVSNRPGPAWLSVGLPEPAAARIYVTAVDPAHRCPLEEPSTAASTSSGRSPGLNVVVPIYGDPVATQACLASLRRQIGVGGALRVILVEDAAPDPEVRALIETYRGVDGFKVLRNARNTGFVGAVNRGLSAIGEGDVLLLNADTNLPVHALARLRAAAAANPGAGTITPFTNNGQYMSFPTPFDVAAMPDMGALEALADAAWAASGTQVVDVPSGIGFCLFVRRACMDALGGLGFEFDKGYYEDVDLCLRAEAAGWRNVCATGVFVGHEGSRSFGADKAVLVSRNRAALDRLHPGFGLRSGIFVDRDPLLEARAAIEDRLEGPRPATMLVVACDAASRARAPRVARRWTEEVGRAGGRILIAALEERGGRRALRLRNATGAAPQNIRVDPDTAADTFAREGVRHAVVLDPAGLEPAFLDALEACGAAIEVAEGDGGLFCPRRHFLQGDGQHCGIPTSADLCQACVNAAGAAVPLPAGVAAWRARWSRLVFGEPQAPLSPYLKRLQDEFQEGEADLRGREPPRRPAPSTRAASLSRPRIGLVPLFETASDLHLLVDLARALGGMPVEEVVVVGRTIDDLKLLALPNVWVTGAVAEDALEEALRLYEITHVVAATLRCAPRHPTLTALRGVGRPLARTLPPALMPDDASAAASKVAARPGDLVLSAALRAQEMAEALAIWSGAPREAVPSPMERGFACASMERGRAHV